MRLGAFIGVVTVLLAGCVAPPMRYYYGNYERAYYHQIKDGTPDSLLKYKAALEDVIATSKAKGLRVPPGIYCEYGYLLAQQGNRDFNRYLDLEVATYPESATFVAFVKTQIKAAQ